MVCRQFRHSSGPDDCGKNHSQAHGSQFSMACHLWNGNNHSVPGDQLAGEEALQMVPISAHESGECKSLQIKFYIKIEFFFF